MEEIDNTKKISLFKRLVGTFLILISISIAVLLAIVFYYSKNLPDYTQLANYYPPATTRIYSADGKLMEEFALEKRIFVPIKSIPKFVKDAFIAAEDRNFYHHPGVDVISIVRSFVRGLYSVSQGKRMAGGSTITQQVVKNFLLNSERSLTRKIKEAILSYRVSQIFSKERVLELYLNDGFFGRRSYGVAAAAKSYFDKSLDELTIAEIAYITALSKAPSAYNPAKNYDRAKGRRDYVINRMLEDGYIDDKVAQEAIKSPIEFKKPSEESNIRAPYFVDHVRAEIIQKFGEEALYRDGFTVITSMNTEYQKYSEESFIRGIRSYDKRHGYRGHVGKINLENWNEELKSFNVPNDILEYEIAVVLSCDNISSKIGLLDGKTSIIPFDEMKWAGSAKSPKSYVKAGDVIIVEKAHGKNYYALRQIPIVNGAIISMNPHTGQVLSMVGGYSYNKNKFNRATQANRQPGSLFKTLVYLSAFERGIKPNSIYSDSPIVLHQGFGLPTWSPKNYKDDFIGPVTMRVGFERSRNPVTVRIAEQVGLTSIAEITRRFGVNKSPPEYYSMVLGSLETNLDKMTNAYSMMMNGGKMVKPSFIEVIKDRNGKVVYKRDETICKDCLVTSDIDDIIIPNPVKDFKIVTDELSAYQITNLLLGATERGRAALARQKLGGIEIGGKTGTTNDSKDAWFVGFNPNLIVGTYVGFDTPRDMGKRETGSNIALPIFIDFMQNALKEKKNIPFPVPDGIEFVNVDYYTGLEAEGAGTISEAFKADLANYHDSRGEFVSDKDYMDLYKELDYKREENKIPVLRNDISNSDSSSEIY